MQWLKSLAGLVVPKRSGHHVVSQHRRFAAAAYLHSGATLAGSVRLFWLFLASTALG